VCRNEPKHFRSIFLRKFLAVCTISYSHMLGHDYRPQSQPAGNFLWRPRDLNAFDIGAHAKLRNELDRRAHRN
jgi:hypothetical protein